MFDESSRMRRFKNRNRAILSEKREFDRCDDVESDVDVKDERNTVRGSQQV